MLLESVADRGRSRVTYHGAQEVVPEQLLVHHRDGQEELGHKLPEEGPVEVGQEVGSAHPPTVHDTGEDPSTGVVGTGHEDLEW